MADLEELFIGLLPNMAWAKNFVTAIYTADTEERAAGLLNFFLSDKAVIVVDGIETSRADFINQAKQISPLRAGASVKFSDSVEAVGNPSLGDRGQAIGLFFNVDVVRKIMFHGAPEVLRKSISMNLVVAIDPDVQRPIGPPIRFFDGRRVMSLNQVTTSTIIRNEFKPPSDS